MCIGVPQRMWVKFGTLEPAALPEALEPPTYAVCRDVGCKNPGQCGKMPVPMHPKQVPKTKEEYAKFVCLSCQTLPCSVCGDQPRSAFAASALKHLRDGQAIRCIDCSHPRCSRPTCTTCTVCRAVGCRKGKRCAGVFQPLHAKQQPNNLDEKRSFRCENCRYLPCQTCGKEMPRGGCRQRFAKRGDIDWTCGDCLTLEESRKVQARNR